MLIDLHVHTNRYSACGRATPEEMVAQAQEVGLEGLVLTEHDLLWPSDEIAALQMQFPGVKLFRGIEVSTAEGEDVLVYGVTEPGLYAARMPMTDLLARAHAHSGVVVLAHPYRYHPDVPALLDRQRVDGVEVYSHNILNYAHPHAKALCAKLGSFAVAASDAHQTDALGLYALRFRQPIAGERDLATALARREFELYVSPARVAAKNIALKSSLEEARSLIASGMEDREIRDRLPAMSLTILRGVRQGIDVLRPGESVEGNP